MEKPIFASDPHDLQTSRGNNFLIGCACLVGALTLFALFVAVVLFHPTDSGKTPRTEEINVGSDFPLYGKTWEDKDFDGENLRGKYVLVKFTATWCGPCQREIPGMLEAYAQYHDKGLEIVSIYIWEREPNANATIKNFVEKEKLPWIILSEPLTQKGGQPPFGETFGIRGVPTMLLVDQEGKVLATDTRGPHLRQELKKLFGE